LHSCFPFVPKNKDFFEVVTKVKSVDDHFTVTDLKEGVEYFFAVAAENEAGVGKQTETDTSIKPKIRRG
jgi:hypothetical protein